MARSLLKKVSTPTLIAAISAMLIVHYTITFYYTTKQSRESHHQQKSTRDLAPPPPPQEPIKHLFPVNKQYYPDTKKHTNTSTSQSKSNNKNEVVAPAVVNSSVVKEKPAEATKPPEPTKPVPAPGNKLILAWTALHSRKPLWGIRPWSFRHCNYSNCEVAGDRKLLDKADMLIFRIRELKVNTSATAYRPYVQPLLASDLPPYHKQDQMWLDINQESPVYTHADEEVAALKDSFNLSSNYLLNSDFTVSYIPEVQPMPPISLNASAADIDYSTGKTKMALWFVSHCNAASGRDEYVRELQKYNITVDIFGKCTGMSDNCIKGDNACFNKLRSQYKFYLALENSICTEYITEKFWNTLLSDSYNIPIGLGASLEEYSKFSPPDSFLHTRNFTTVKALADYMHKVDGDNELFNSYHQWRKKYVIKPRYHAESLHCYMCRQANEKKEGKMEYKDISKYWSRKTYCEMEPEPIK